ncbi:MAG: MFS transporter [Burkholderiales bacterium]|nr:MFS transporter [Burkholderiales bacterium]
MSASEIRAAIGLAGIFGLRMLGLFVILPVFALYAANLRGGDNLTLVGIALGAYGLSQAVLQIPFGRWSDRVGRKPALYTGLAIFAFGSVCAGYASSIQGVIAGRALQGAGAISAVAIAMAADLTRDEHRTKVMAIIGSTIGASFGLSLVLGPWLDRVIGVAGIFYLIGGLALLAMAVVLALPVPPAERMPAEARASVALSEVLRDPELNRLNVGIFVLHAVLMSLFLTVPFDLNAAGLAAHEHWKMYAAVMLGAAVLMLPGLHFGDRRGHSRVVFLGSIALLLASQVMLVSLSERIAGIAAGLLVFFTGFMVLEAALPAQVSRQAPAGARGTAIAVYSTVQFLGAACGGALGGYVMQHWGRISLLACNGVLILAWLAAAASMRAAGSLERRYPLPPMDDTQAALLRASLVRVTGVREARVHAHAGLAHLKVDAGAFDEREVLKLIAGES